MPKKKIPASKITTVVRDTELARIETLAKLAVARVALTAAVENIDEAIGHFIDPSDDPKGKRRADAIGAAEEAVGEASIALNDAGERVGDIDPEVGEPESDEDEDDEEEDDVDEDDDDDDEEDEDDDE